MFFCWWWLLFCCSFKEKKSYWPWESYFWPPFEPHQSCYWWEREKILYFPQSWSLVGFFLSKCRLEKTDDFREAAWRYIGQLILCMSGFCTTLNKIANEQIQLLFFTATDFCRNYTTDFKPSPGLFCSVCPYTLLRYSKHNRIFEVPYESEIWITLCLLWNKKIGKLSKKIHVMAKP